jgi:hypothetical protein
MEANMSENKLLSDKLIKLFETVFEDLNENIESAARNCTCSDASTALYEMTSAINMMDFPYLIREALDVPHHNQE